MAAGVKFKLKNDHFTLKSAGELSTKYPRTSERETLGYFEAKHVFQLRFP